MRFQQLGVLFVASRFAERSANGSSTWVGSQGEPVPPPTADEFYNVTNVDLPSYTNGDIIRHREVGLGNFTSAARAYQLLYRTENTFGDAMATVTTIIVPTDGDNDKMVSYQAFEDASYLDCAPSYQLSTGSGTLIDVQTLLNEGLVVNVPDHEGLNSSFCAGWLEGKMTLDSLRAVKNSESITGYNASSKIALWGYSGGSFASGWAAELQPSYAPEIEIQGIAVGGYVVDLKATVQIANKGPFVGFVPAGLAGLGTEYPDLWDTINEHANSTMFEQLVPVFTQCLEQNVMQLMNKDVFSFFDNGEDILESSPFKEILKNNSLGQTAPKVPMYIYQGAKDQLAPVSAVERVVNYYCSHGASVTYNRIEDRDHFSTQVFGVKDALDWLKLALNGQAGNGTCKATNNSASGTDNVDPMATVSASITTDAVSASASYPGSNSSTTQQNAAANLIQAGAHISGIAIAFAALLL